MRWDFPYDSPHAIIALLDQMGLSMSKRFGQNFLLSKAVRERIVASLGQIEGKQVWEIGPGIGALTAPLLDAGAWVTAFEIDHGFCRILRDQAFTGENRFALVEGDVLKTWEGISASQGIPDRICGNLPYNVGSVCIARLIEEQCLPERMVFTLQKEVAERLCATVADKAWSAFTILARIDYDIEPLFSIKSGAFYPSPNVTSSVIGMTRRVQPLVAVAQRKEFLEVVDDLFTQRRKTVKNNLLNGESGRRFPREHILSALADSGISPDERAERLDIDQILDLCGHLHMQSGSSALL
ncbi:MAG: 16S rRNA (adenine(1518)-N(6)/adenine(1519)-N(6))-dimethyltransferase RsmA [Sphaerochaetaceae bacterium]